MKMPINHPDHPHRELILQWIQGAKIQAKNGSHWRDTMYPHWLTHAEYRIAKTINKRTKQYFMLTPCTRMSEADCIVNFINGTPSSVKLVSGAFI